VNRNGEFTVNIALIDDGMPVLGVVYVPVTGVCYLAVRDQGAWKETGGCDRQSIRVRRYRGGRATVVASRSHRGDAVDKFLANLKAREGEYDTASLGSSLKLCRWRKALPTSTRVSGRPRNGTRPPRSAWSSRPADA